MTERQEFSNRVTLLESSPRELKQREFVGRVEFLVVCWATCLFGINNELDLMAGKFTRDQTHIDMDVFDELRVEL